MYFFNILYNCLNKKFDMIRDSIIELYLVYSHFGKDVFIEIYEN